MSYGLYRKSSGGGATGVNTMIAGTGLQFQETIDFAITNPLNLGRSGNTITLQGHNLQRVPNIAEWLNVDGGQENAAANYNPISFFAGDTHGANSGIVLINGNPSYDQTHICVLNWAQLGLAQIEFQAGPVSTPNIIVPAGKVAKTRAKGAMVTIMWITATDVLIMGDLANA